MFTAASMLEFVKSLSFIRWGGTEAEKEAARRITEKVEKAGGTCEWMPFSIPSYSCSVCRLSVPGSSPREIPAVPYGRGGNLEGEYKLLYLERGTEMDYLGLGDLSDTLVMINSLNIDAYRLLCTHHAAGFITITGKYYDAPDLMPRPLRDTFLGFGRIPGFMIMAKDAMDLVSAGTQSLYVSLQQEETSAESQNILCTIPGTDLAGESIVLTAHYDSVLSGTGAWDNATGSAALLYLCTYFLQHPSRRTLRFIWCGAEEQGLLGSKAYVHKYADLLPEIRFCFNFDMNGTILGPNRICVTGGEALKSFTEQYCREHGWSADIRCGVHSSDSAPFCDQGIPAIDLSRGTPTAEIHTKNDLAVILSGDQILEIARFASRFISRVADSAVLPVDVGMPPEMQEELDRYFLRDKVKSS
ncbi:MAG: Zn-dependent exopeptidase M28 [Clostridia bacterium]|nr:Zn-dependent exopeptidase M28 [Clostridia bacterium]